MRRAHPRGQPPRPTDRGHPGHRCSFFHSSLVCADRLRERESVFQGRAARGTARTVLSAAADCFNPLQLSVAVSNACERILHLSEAVEAENSTLAVLFMDFNIASNHSSCAAARAGIDCALPVLSRSFTWVYGQDAPTVYGWADPSAPPASPNHVPIRHSQPVERGAQKKGLLGPTLYAAGFHLGLERLDVQLSDFVLAAYLDDPSAAMAVSTLTTFIERMAELGAEVDAEFAPSKCVSWSPL